MKHLKIKKLYILGPPPPSNVRVISSTTDTMLLEWNDECEDNPALCEDDRTTYEYVIKYNLAGGGVVLTRRMPGAVSQYVLAGANSNSDYEITMMIVARESNVFSDQSQIVFGTTSK